MPRAPSITVLVLLGACQGPRIVVDSSGESNEGSTSTSSASSVGAETTTTDESSGEGGGAFLPLLDASANECDIWAQNCAPGEKCTSYADDRRNYWNANKCVPIVPSPVGSGERCTVEGNATTGVDNCDGSSICWDVDPATNEGTCVAFCVGTEANPTCDEPCKTCVVANQGVLILCLSACDPIVQDCGDGEACHAYNGNFVCAPDRSSPDIGLYGDPCEFPTTCDPGLYCAPADQVPNCEGEVGCCAPFCDLDDPECPDAELGVECVPWYAPAELAPICLATAVGSCLVP